MSKLGNVDCQKTSKGVWLVKVPKYLSEKWQQEAGTSEVGRLKIVSGQNTKPEVVFHSHPYIAQNDSTNSKSSKDPLIEQKTMMEHKFIIHNLDKQSLVILSDDRSGTSKFPLSIEGRVVQKADCQPSLSKDYMKMKVSQIEAASKPVRSAQMLGSAPRKFLPTTKHAQHAEADRQKKEGKSFRLEKDQLRLMIFQAFEKHQFYHIKDLVQITKQPNNFITEILREIAEYRTTMPHKFTWELKPEYRHYGSENRKTAKFRKIQNE